MLFLEDPFFSIRKLCCYGSSIQEYLNKTMLIIKIRKFNQFIIAFINNMELFFD